MTSSELCSACVWRSRLGRCQDIPNVNYARKVSSIVNCWRWTRTKIKPSGGSSHDQAVTSPLSAPKSLDG